VKQLERMLDEGYYVEYTEPDLEESDETDYNDGSLMPQSFKRTFTQFL
jgi:hypothetical protein